MLPRPIVPGATYLITRRCTQRQFLMVPSAKVNRVILFCLARAAALYGIHIHVICVLGNHFHIVLTDPLGLLSEFTRWANEHIARALNRHLGRRESFFESSARGSYVRLFGSEDVLEKMVYTLANPVAAGLVAKGSQWPGVRTAAEQLGETLEVERPELYFRPDGPVPEKVKLELVVPPAFKAGGVDAFRRRLSAAVEAKEAELRQRAREEGRRFKGASAVRLQLPLDSPSTPREFGKLNPRVACRDKERRKQILTELRAFWQAYKLALAGWFAGKRSVVFPAATYLMRRKHRVRCRPFSEAGAWAVSQT